VNNKVAVITGAARGLGKAIALRLSKENYSIVIVDILEEEGKQLKEEIKKNNEKDVLYIKTDLRSLEDIKIMTEIVINKLGKIDILVNNAGIVIRSPFLEVTEEIYDMILDVNLKGTFFCSQLISKEMIRKGNGGKIINISSMLGEVGYPHSELSPYVASKAAVINLTKQMALELSPYKINVNSIGPGIMQTEITSKSRNNEKHVKNVLNDIPLGRYAKPEDITGMVSFLASDESNYLTGTTIFIDGGWLAH